MLTIETPNGLVNWSNYDRIHIKKTDWSDYDFELVAIKHVGASEDFGWSEPILCGGSEAWCQNELTRITNAISNDERIITITHGDPKPEPKSEPDMGYSLLDDDPGPDELYF